MKRIIFVFALLAASTAGAQVTSSDLMGLGMPGPLADKVSSVGQTMAIDGDANRLFTHGATSDTALTFKFGDGSTAAQTLSITSKDADASDDSELLLSAGGAIATDGSRGAAILTYGNEHGSSPGKLEIIAGNAAGDGRVQIITKASAAINLLTANTQRMSISGTGATTFTGTVTSSASADLGWAVVDGTDNTACTSQCTNAAVFGFNLSAGATAPVLVGPSDATADICLCAGAS